MTRLGKVVRTTAFKLSVIYIAVFSLFALAFVVYITYATNVLLTRQISDTIGVELLGLSDQYHIGGLTAVAGIMEERANLPGASLYMLTDGEGHILAGNVVQVPAAILNKTGEEPVTIRYQRYAGDTSQHQAMVQVVKLASGYRVLVGRDLGEQQTFRDIVGGALVWALVVMIGLALVSYVFVSRRVLKRIDALSASSVRIMNGDLSGRLEITGSGDEFDRLAESLNAMLNRIELLLYGLKDVSDNIAHDLKTPLTRLRNRVEAALSSGGDAAAYRASLEATIEESDNLIKTFNALLAIARIEAGSPDGTAEPVDASAIARDVAELYEPVADELGINFAVSTPAPVMIRASRELLSQTIANLVDNAIKHATAPDAARRASRIAISTASEGGFLLLRVADDGPGIPEEDRERVLRRFVRLEKSRSLPGSGLGLSLVAAVAHLHHGAVELGDGNPGLVVTVRLPLS